MKENSFLKTEVFGYFQLVEKVIGAFGVDPEKARGEKQLYWTIYQGKTPIWFRLNYIKYFKEYFIQVTAPIMRMPEENKEAFSKQLISLNATLVGAAFTENKGMVYISTSREFIDLDFEEACNLVSRVLNYTRFYNHAKQNGLLNWPPYVAQNSSRPGPSSLS